MSKAGKKDSTKSRQSADARPAMDVRRRISSAIAAAEVNLRASGGRRLTAKMVRELERALCDIAAEDAQFAAQIVAKPAAPKFDLGAMRSARRGPGANVREKDRHVALFRDWRDIERRADAMFKCVDQALPAMEAAEQAGDRKAVRTQRARVKRLERKAEELSVSSYDVLSKLLRTQPKTLADLAAAARAMAITLKEGGLPERTENVCADAIADKLAELAGVDMSP